MADYYPLIARAVAALQPNTPEARRTVYDRARNALAGQLRSIEPPLGEDIIRREVMALEAVVARLEAEAGSPSSAPIEKPHAPLDDPNRPPTVIRPLPAARPRAPERRAPKKSSPWVALFVGIGVAIVAGVAVLAIANKQRLSEIALRPVGAAVPQPGAGQPQASGPKIGERVGTDGAAPPPLARPAPPPLPPPAAPQPPPPPAAQPQLPVAHRLVMIEEGAGDQQPVVPRQGTVVWRADTDPGGQGQPLQSVIRASLDIPDARLKGEITIRKNIDPTFSASHTVEVSFQPQTGDVTSGIKTLAGIEMRQNDTQPGAPLIGLSVPVTDNLFLVGLTNVEPAMSRNVDLLRTRDWFFFETRFGTGKRGAFLFEKGATGNQVFEDVFSRW